MSDNTPWWFGLSQQEIGAELAEEARQDRLAEETYRELLALPEEQVGRTDEF
jgi:hypothetical protein